MKYKKNFTDVFPAIFSEVNGSELMVYLYICHHYCLSDQQSIKITYEEMCNGTLLDSGTTLSKDTLRRSIESLKKKKLMKVKKKEFVLNGTRFTPCYYHPMLPLQNRTRTDFALIDDLDDDGPSGLMDDLTNSTLQNRDRADFATSAHTDFKSHSSLNSLKKELIKKKEEVSILEEKTNRHANLPLLNNSTAKNQEPPDKFYLAAEQLKKALIAKDPCLLSTKSDLAAWTRRFKKYANKHPHFKWSAFKAVLDWYCGNIKADKYTPQAFCADSFCEKFGKIKLKMENQQSAVKEDFHSTENLPPPEDDTPPLDDQLRRDAMSHLL